MKNNSFNSEISGAQNSNVEEHSTSMRLDAQTPWLMPDGIRDYIGAEVAQVESLRRSCLKLFSQRGYQHVIPPPIEYLDSLLWGGNQDLALQTLKVTDQMSGQLMGFRADITPQIARIDRANIAQRQNNLQQISAQQSILGTSANSQQNSSQPCSQYINRFSYIGHVLHAKPMHLTAPRHLMQAGVEVFGGEVVATDLEILLLLIDVLVEMNLVDSTSSKNSHAETPIRAVLSLGNVGIIHALCEDFNLSDEDTRWLISVLRRKSQPDLHSQGLRHGLTLSQIQLLDELMQIYGSQEVFQTAAKKFPLGKAHRALEELRQLYELANQYFVQEYEKAIDLDWFIDPLTIPSYDYHTGFVFSVHCGSAGIPIASGGRYQLDHQGVECPRSGTGFSLDLLSILPFVQNSKNPQNTQLVWVESNVIQQYQIPFYIKLRKSLTGDWKIQWASGDLHADAQQKKLCSHMLVIKNATEFELQKIN